MVDTTPTLQFDIKPWLLQNNAPEIFGRPMEEIEWLFTGANFPYHLSSKPVGWQPSNWSPRWDPWPAPYPAPGSSLYRDNHKPEWYLWRIVGFCYYKLRNGLLQDWTRNAIAWWDLESREGGSKEAVRILFGLEKICNPIYWIHEGSEEMMKECFGGEFYWDELQEQMRSSWEHSTAKDPYSLDGDFSFARTSASASSTSGLAGS